MPIETLVQWYTLILLNKEYWLVSGHILLEGKWSSDFSVGKKIYKKRNKTSQSLLWQILRQRQRLFLVTDCPPHCCKLQDRKTVARLTGKHNINKSLCWYFGKSLDFHEIHFLVANTLNFSEETRSWSYSSRPLCRSSEHCLFWNYK